MPPDLPAPGWGPDPVTAGVRFNPPDSIRLDLIEPGGSGVQSAVLIDEEVRYIGERRIQLPPPTFLWAVPHRP